MPWHVVILGTMQSACGGVHFNPRRTELHQGAPPAAGRICTRCAPQAKS